MAPLTRTLHPNDNSDAAREAARQAALRRREIYMQIRAHLSTLYPSHSNLVVRSQQTAGADGGVGYVSMVLSTPQAPSRITPSTPVIHYDSQYYDDRLVAAADVAQYIVILNGTPGVDQTEGMARLLERVEILVRSGWRAG